MMKNDEKMNESDEKVIKMMKNDEKMNESDEKRWKNDEKVIQNFK